jgi:phage terminase Nu1 subunit (DNA packaging protein)
MPPSIDAEYLDDDVVDDRDVDAVLPQIVSAVEMLSVLQEDAQQAIVTIRERLGFGHLEPYDLAGVERWVREATRASAPNQDRSF